MKTVTRVTAKIDVFLLTCSALQVCVRLQLGLTLFRYYAVGKHVFRQALSAGYTWHARVGADRQQRPHPRWRQARASPAASPTIMTLRGFEVWAGQSISWRWVGVRPCHDLPEGLTSAKVAQQCSVYWQAIAASSGRMAADRRYWHVATRLCAAGAGSPNAGGMS